MQVPKLYSAQWCSPCKSLKLLLSKMNVKYEYIDIDREPERSMADGVRGIPTLVLGKHRLVGAVTEQQLVEFLAR